MMARPKKPVWSRFRLSYCEACGRDTQLTVHHIDGNAFNNARDNLRTLCRECHNEVHHQESKVHPRNFNANFCFGCYAYTKTTLDGQCRLCGWDKLSKVGKRLREDLRKANRRGAKFLKGKAIEKSAREAGN